MSNLGETIWSYNILSTGKTPWRRKWLSIPVFLPGESHGQRSLVGYSPKELDTTWQLTLSLPYRNRILFIRWSCFWPCKTYIVILGPFFIDGLAYFAQAVHVTYRQEDLFFFYFSHLSCLFFSFLFLHYCTGWNILAWFSVLKCKQFHRFTIHFIIF